MKRILITGAGSYIGMSVEKWLLKPEYDGVYQVDTLDMKKEKWIEYDFSQYTSVLHVAGIAHADVEKLSKEQEQLYYKINCDLAVKTAKKAKESGVKQFIYMSSIIVYGEGTSVRKKRVITRETKPHPSNYYGDSKWKAEQMLQPLGDECFHIAILRPPMIYGVGCKGNYRMLEKMAVRFPIFPDFPNQRSVLHIDNFCRYTLELIENGGGGIYFPQDFQYVKTSDLVKAIAVKNGKRIYLTKAFNWLIYILSFNRGKIGKLVNKAFGTFILDMENDN